MTQLIEFLYWVCTQILECNDNVIIGPQVDLYAKMIERPKMVQDNTPESVQEITLEGEKTNNRNYFCKVTIRRRPTDLQYLGELYLEEDTSSSSSSNQNAAGSTGGNADAGKGGRACKFSLGSKLNAQK